MSNVTEHAPGSFCWMELGTTDAASAKAFYSQLFGWNTTDSPAGPDTVYTMLQRGDENVGGLYEMNEEQQAQGIPPHWLSYVATDNVDDKAAKADDLGGTVVMEPFDVMDVGRMAVLQDPSGATFALWQARNHIGADVVGEPGALCWAELATRDPAAATAFYTGLFGWDTQVQNMGSGPYTSFLHGEQPVGGMLRMTEEWGDIPPHWMPYFGVAACDAAIETAKELGGAVNFGPIDIPDAGRFAVITDPQGAAFSIIQMDAFE